jgi:succinoglycan biosynthesis transport protein ExoP
MGNSQRREGMDISAFFGFLRRRGLIILLAVIVGAIAGYAISKSKADEYTGSATLLLRGNSTNQQQAQFEPGVPDAAQDRESLVTSDPVRARAIRQLTPALGRAQATKLVKKADATSSQDASTVDISIDAPTAKAAAAVPNALGRATIGYRKDTEIARVNRALKVAQNELDKAGSNSPSSVTLTQNVQNLRQTVATADGDADLTARATTPDSPSSPKPKRDALIGAFAGLLIGFILAMVREQLDRRLKQPKDLEDVFGLPVLASVPRSRAFSSSNNKALDQLPPGEAESFQMLRANLHFLHTDKLLKSVVVTSPGVGDGKSTISVNLAKADASVGQRVLLIEADMRRPRLGGLLGIDSQHGLAAYLSDPSVSFDDVANSFPVTNRTNGHGAPSTMDVIVAGSVPSNPSELINSQRMRDLVKEAEENYDPVVIDTSPAGMVADAIPLMSEATAVLIVGRVGRATGSEAGSLRQQLERIDAPTFGLVANFAGSESAYGYY